MNKNEVMKKVEQDIQAAKEAFLYKEITGDKGKENLSSELSPKECGSYLKKLEKEFEKKIIGQDKLIHQLTLALALNEHILLEGLPGVGKTIMIDCIAQVVGLSFQRVQFIPDMLPSDLIGRDDIDPVLLAAMKAEAVQWINGPLFSSMVLADEINRAPSKVQAALLEAMGEAQITPFGKDTKIIRSTIHEAAVSVGWEKSRGLFGLPPINPEKKGLSHFNVFATMNPIEQEGTYPLSEAQIDRFCFKINVPYPQKKHYKDIAESAFRNERPEKPKVVTSNAKFDDYRSHFERNPDDLDPILAPVYFFLLCRDHILGGISKKRENGKDTLWEEFKDSEQLKKIFSIVSISSLKNPSLDAVGSDRLLEDPLQVEIRTDIEKLRKKNPKVHNLRTNKLFEYIKTGASPRGFLKLIKVALCESLMNGGEPFADKDIRKNAKNVLKHRIRMDVQARLDGITSEHVIDALCNAILD